MSHLLAAEGGPWVYLLLIAAGLFSVAGGVFDWDFFMNSRKAKFFVMIFKRAGARIIYVLLGLGIATMGVLMWSGAIDGGSRSSDPVEQR